MRAEERAERFREIFTSLTREIAKVVVGHDEIVRGVLARSPLVAGFRTAAEDAGGWGATLVDLK